MDQNREMLQMELPYDKQNEGRITYLMIIREKRIEKCFKRNFLTSKMSKI